MKYIIILLLVLAAAFVAFKIYVKSHILDGPGMVYEWPNYELQGTWESVSKDSYGKKTTLIIDADKIRMSYSSGEDAVFGYTLPENVVREGRPRPGEEIRLNLVNCREFESLIFSEEDPGNGFGAFPVLSGTIFEYDGRGEIVIAEFVRTDNPGGTTEDFESAVRKSHNSWEGVPKSWLEAPGETAE